MATRPALRQTWCVWWRMQGQARPGQARGERAGGQVKGAEKKKRWLT